MKDTGKSKADARSSILMRAAVGAATAAALVLTSLVAGGPAHATAPSNPPLNSDANTYRYGLNITWTSGGPGVANAISRSDGTYTVGANPFAASFDVGRLVDEIAALGFDYVQVTDFHGAGTVLHPSAVLDSWRGPGYTTSEDIIGELIDGLAARGIGTFLFTHPLDPHDYTASQQDLLGANDPAGGYKKWNDFINAFYAELVDTYGSRIAGIGFDSELGLSGDARWANKLDLPRLRNTILSRQPDMWLGALAYPSLGGRTLVDFPLKEVFRPDWFGTGLAATDYDVTKWPASTSAPNVVTQNHWATLGDYLTANFNIPSSLGVFSTTGAWTVENEELRGSTGIATMNLAAGTQSETGWRNTFGDGRFTYAFRLVSDGGNATNWAGFQFRKNAAGDSWGTSGYLVIFRSNGQIELSRPGVVLSTVSTGSTFTSRTQVRIEASGPRIRVYLGAETTPRIDVADSTYSAGFAGFAVAGADARFDDLVMERVWTDPFASAGAWTVGSGSWSAASGVYTGNEGRATVTGKTWANSTYAVDLRILDAKGNPANWAGVQVRKQAQNDQFFDSGYLVYARANGEVCLYEAGVGNLACAPSGVDFTATQRLKVVTDGPSLRVYVGDARTALIDVKDATFASGYAGLSTSGAMARFDDFTVNAAPISKSRLTSAQVFRYTVLQAGAATQGPGVGWSYSPFSDGQWEVGAKETLAGVKSLMDPVRASIIGTMPSNSYPRAEGVTINTLPNGIVATRKRDDSREYIHVLTPPSGSTLTLPVPADGKTFSSARLLSTGAAVSLTQNGSGVALTLPAGATWNTTDTVIELVTSSIGTGRYGGTGLQLVSNQGGYRLRGTGDFYPGGTTDFAVAGVPAASAGVEDRWSVVYLGNDRYKIVNEYRNKMLRMTTQDYQGNPDLSAVAMVANGSPTTSDQWVLQPYLNDGLRLVNVGFGRPLHLTGDGYLGSSTVRSICGVPSFFNSAEDLWKLVG